MDVLVQVRGRTQPAVQTCRNRITNDLTHLRLRLEPLHPASTDADLRSWFVAYSAAAGDAERVVRELLTHPDVAAAYVKPPGAPA